MDIVSRNLVCTKGRKEYCCSQGESVEKEGLNRRHFSAVTKRCVSCLHHKLLSSQMKVLRRIVL